MLTRASRPLAFRGACAAALLALWAPPASSQPAAPDGGPALLDEIVAHLDAVRRAALFDEILSLGAQAWMTGTDLQVFSPLKGKADLFEVANSQVRMISE